MTTAGEYAAPRRTDVDHETLRASIALAWHELRKEVPSSDCTSILLAQSAFETGWGRSFKVHPRAESPRAFTALFLHEYEEAGIRASAGDVAGFVAALKDGGYFTGPLEEYQRGVAALWDGYREPCLATRWEVV